MFSIPTSAGSILQALLPWAAVACGIAALVWSADRFVGAAAAAATRLGAPPLLVGMVIIGFGTSLPEMAVSALSAFEGSPGIALGNAYGSNIANIGLILGVSALITPFAVRASVLCRELPLLAAVSLLSWALARDGTVSRAEALALLAVFGAWIAWSTWDARRLPQTPGSRRGGGVEPMAAGKIALWLAVGLAGLLASSRALVWGAVEIASAFGVSDLVIGLTVVAVGTSLPELASSVAAARRGEHELALGNVIGSNLFNTLVVVGIAGGIRAIEAEASVARRDIPAMLLFTFSLFLFGAPWRGRGTGRFGRVDGAILLLAYAAYVLLLFFLARHPAA